MIVSDSSEVLKSLSLLLETEGYRTITATDEARALALASAAEPDTIIVAFPSPEAEALKICRHLKEDARTAPVPVLLASAASLRSDYHNFLQFGRRAGADDCLEDFFNREEVLVKAARLTERHRVEQIYRQAAKAVGAKEEWETTFNAMSNGVFIFNEKGSLLRANRAGAALEDVLPQQLIGRSCCQILRTTPEECIVTRSLAEKRRLTDEIEPGHLNRSLLFTAEPIIGSDGRTAGAVCTVHDLSELRKVEVVVREWQSLLTSILESAREAIYALDTEGRFRWCNKGTTVVSGYAPEDLIGRHFRELAHPADRKMVAECFERALKGEPQSYEISYQAADGDIRYALIDDTPLVVDGHTKGVLGIARDITEQRVERERAAQADKLRALGQLASGVAHDFNNALTAILGRAQLLRRLIQDATLAPHLEVIQTAAADAAATVRRIQTFARQPRIKEYELLNVASLLRGAIELTRTRWHHEASTRGLHYDVQLEADDNLYVEGSASELREVFVNLIVNAVDAMPKGGTLSIICRRDGDRLQLLFRDTGAGMLEEVRARIFEPFYTTKGSHGTGLGLFVSYGIIERHKGLISVESEPGHGAVFTIDLPAIETNFNTSSVQRNEAADFLPTVLVVDDELYVRETLAEMVSTLARKVIKAAGGRAALAAVSGESFDLIFVDLSMPGMDGWELSREIRRSQPHANIVLVTGYGQEIVPPSGEETQVDAILGKPFDFAQVADVIKQFASRQSPPTEKTRVRQKAG